MKRILLLALFAVVLFTACDKERWGHSKVVNLKKVTGYELVYEPIGEEAFRDMFQPGWYCSSVHDVYPDGSLGDEYPYDAEPNRFSIKDKHSIKIYDLFQDFESHYSYRYVTYGYDEDENYLSLRGYHTVYYSNPGVHVALDGGTVVSMTESSMDLVTPVWKYDGYASDKAVFTMYRFKKLTEEKVAQLDSLYTEGN